MFLILDCWDNFEYFKLQPKGKELKPQLPLPVRLVGLAPGQNRKGHRP
jgi:type I restriction enzyme, R subunit